MDNADSFMNWGFAPSKQASGWVLVETGNSFWEDMEMDHHYLPYIRCYSVGNYKEKVISLTLSEISDYLHERDELQYYVLELFDNNDEHPIIIPVEIKIFQSWYALPTECSFWFPQLAQNQDYDTMRDIMLGQRPMLGIDRAEDWVSTGVKKFINSILDKPDRINDSTFGEAEMRSLIERGDKTSPNRYYPLTVFECKFDNEFQVNQVALYLERIRGED